MRKLVFAAITAVVLSAATASLAQEALRGAIPPPEQWIDRPALAPAVTDAETRARMNQEIVQAITAAEGDQEAARRAIAAIVARYQAAAEPQSARMRPGPK